MTRIVSNCRFAAMGYEHHYTPGQPQHCLLIKGRFKWDANGHITPVDERAKILLEDVYLGAEQYSSVLCPNDLAPRKPMTDLFVTGAAVPLQGRACAQWEASLQIGQWRKALILSGPRTWQYRLLGGWQLSSPEPTEAVQLCYENAYGGNVMVGEQRQWWPHNALGQGFLGETQADAQTAYPAAQIEYPQDRLRSIDQPIAVAGFGPMNDYFEDRMQFAGQYDDEAAKAASESPKNGPYIPDDFKLDFWQYAPLDQRFSPYLKGGEVLTLTGFTAQGQLNLKLPQYRMRAILKYQDGDRDTEFLDLDTIHVDLDRKELTLRWYGSVPFDDQLDEITLVDMRDVVAPFRARAQQ